MNALEDRRPVAAYTTASDSPSVIGEDLAQLLLDNPDLELASIRLIPNDDGTIGIAGRIGPITTDECPSCHTTDGHPHTDYCNLTKPLAGNIEIRDPQPTKCACPNTTLLGHRNNCPVYGESWRRVRGIDPPLARGGEGARPGKLED